MSLKASSGSYGAKLAESPPAAGVAAASASPASLSLSILLAEEEASQAARLEKALRILGHVVASKTCDGQEACRLCQEIKPDLVLMDQTLPKLDGLQAAFVINRNQPMPVVLMASQAKSGLVSEAQRAGVYAFVFKPVDHNLLAQSIQVAYQQFKLVRDLQYRAEGLRQEIKTRKLMGRASGILMKQLGSNEQEAIRRIYEEAKSKGLSPMEVALDIITADKISNSAS
jgi:AmiR/NasT family two-component response regulator